LVTPADGWPRSDHDHSFQQILVSLFAALAAVSLFPSVTHADWEPVPGRIMTQWAEQVAPFGISPSQLVRSYWSNLNGLWDYAVTKVDDPQPAEFEGKILVPFCI